METILKSFGIGFLLRSAFAGTFFVFAWQATTNSKIAGGIDSKNIFSVELAIALVAGVTVYGIHRSLVFPFIEWALSSDWAKKLRRTWLPLVSRNARHDIVGRWESRASNKDDKLRYCAEQITGWGDFVHSQYVAAWCILSGAAMGTMIDGECAVPHWRAVFISASLFAVAATVSAWRARSVEEHFRSINRGTVAT